MNRGAAGIGAALVVAGGAVLAFALLRKPEPVVPEMSSQQVAAMASSVEKLNGKMTEAHSIARTRAETISGNGFLKNGIKSMDKATVADQVANGEAKYDPSKGEVIEVGSFDGKGGFDVLALQPDTAKPLAYGAKLPRSTTMLDGNRIVIYELSEVKDDGKAIGYVTVAQTRSLETELADIAAAGVVGRLELGSAKVEVGGALPAEAPTQTMKLKEPDAQLIVAAPLATAPARSLPLIGVGAGGTALGLLLVMIGMMAKKVEPQAASPSPADSLANDPARTRLSAAAIAAGTPSPVDLQAGGPSINPSNIGAGAMIGRWEVVRRLGSGGMADVFLAQSKGEAGFEKLVAIKVMHPHLARNERAVEHFLDEARLAARIHHPNVVAIQDLGKIGNDYVIVMEYVEGVDLERLLVSARNANRTIPLDVGLGILCRICDGLNAAHTAVGADGQPLDLIHRDVKSANVLVSRQGGVKVVDFGIAKAATQSHMTQAGETKGTPSMMAPEQRVGELVDVRADVYSVAAVGYEILTGHGVNLDLAALAHLGVDNWPHLPLPSSLRPGLPPEVDALLLTAMAFERDRRPPDCAALEAQFEAVMKRNGMGATDKDIARWVDGELRLLVPAYEGASRTQSKPAGIS